MPQPKILVVEDELVVALNTELELNHLGFHVVGTARTGEEAVQLVEENSPDLVLMDIQLQGKEDGIDVAARIRRKWEIPVIFTTAYVNDETVARAIKTGPYGYITKPYGSRELNATITVALEQHHLVREIFAEHGWLRTMLAGMNDGVVATDVMGRVKYLNPAAESFTGWTLAEANGLAIENIYRLKTEDGSPVDVCQLRRVLASGKSIDRQKLILVARNGRQLAVEDSAAPIRDVQGVLVGAVTTIVDITERQRMERERDRLLRELERSNIELERFSYAIAHDLQNPLRTVRSYAELLCRRLTSELTQDDAELLQLMVNAAGNMQGLISSLLEYARAGHGKLKLDRVSVAEVVKSVEADLALLMSETGTQIVCGPLPVVTADRVQLKQLFENLVVNAIRYCEREQAPRIVISSEPAEEGWQFTVSDNGVGIASENQTRIFDLLTRLHGADVPGSGMGLAICRGIAERHGGHIWVDSQGVGRGSTFHFVIGLLQPAAHQLS